MKKIEYVWSVCWYLFTSNFLGIFRGCAILDYFWIFITYSKMISLLGFHLNGILLWKVLALVYLELSMVDFYDLGWFDFFKLHILSSFVGCFVISTLFPRL